MVERRVLVLLPGNKLFGQERALMNLGMLFRDLEIESTYLIHRGWGTDTLGKELTAQGFQWLPLSFGTIWSIRLLAKNPAKIFGNLISLVIVSAEVGKILRSRKYEAIILGNVSFAVYMVPALVFSKIRVIFRHGDAPNDGNIIARFLSRRVYRRANAHVANCEYLARVAADFDRRIDSKVIYNFPVDRLKGRALSSVDSSLSRRLLFVGQLSHHKGAHLALGAFDQLAQRYDDLSMDMVGPAPGVDQYTDNSVLTLLEALQVKWPERLRYHGFLSDPAPLFQSAYLHLCPSIWPDPSPNVIFEAKIQGVPTVAFARGGIAELIRHKVDGYLCGEESVAGLAAGAEFFLGDPSAHDCASRQALDSLNGKFSYATFRQAWSQVLSC